MLDGDSDGVLDGDSDGVSDGDSDGASDGDSDGDLDGVSDGETDGETDGSTLIVSVGSLVSLCIIVSTTVVTKVGEAVGVSVFEHPFLRIPLGHFVGESLLLSLGHTSNNQSVLHSEKSPLYLWFFSGHPSFK